jgi:hypothetical protein
MDTGVLILIVLAFVVALLVILIKSGKGEAVLKLFGAQISAKAGQEQQKNVITSKSGSMAKSTLQQASKDSPGQNIIELEEQSIAEDNVQSIE